MNKLYYMDAGSLSEMEKNLAQTKEGFSLGDFINQRETVRFDKQRIAYIDVRGGLIDDAPNIYKELGNTDYRDIRGEIAGAMAEGAKGIIFTVDSPGGTVAGAEETAKMIEALPIPSVTYYHGLGCSAAYKVFCSATAIVAAPSAEVGNIGTILTYQDASKYMEKLGVTTHSITNEGADLKSTFHSMPLTAEQEAFLQESINEAGEAFKNHVQSNRPGISEEVFKAGWYKGEKALELGLIDHVGGLMDAREILQATINT
jgi:protease-4